MRLALCWTCRHYHNDADGKEFCDAFPEGLSSNRIKWSGGNEECADGIKYENKNGGYEEFVPEPDSILAKMHRIG